MSIRPPMAQRELPPKTGNGGGSYWQTCWQLWAGQEMPAVSVPGRQTEELRVRSQLDLTLTPTPSLPTVHHPGCLEAQGPRPKGPHQGDLVSRAPPACNLQLPPLGSAWRPCDSCTRMDAAQPVTSSQASLLISWTPWGQLCETPRFRGC